MLSLAVQVSIFFFLLTSKERKKVLIFDDSTYDRSRSKVVELLAWVFDHTSLTSLKDFKMLTPGWSDGASFLPLDFALCSSANAKKEDTGYQEGSGKKGLGPWC
jgi:hypothetical protein